LINKYPDKIISGMDIAKDIRKELKEKIIEQNQIMKPKYYDKPVFGYVLVSNKPES